MTTPTELPDLTTYSREQLIELAGILHHAYVQAATRFDEALALLRERRNDPAALTSEQGKAWRERAETAERENERLSALVAEMREALVVIRDETIWMDEPAMPINRMLATLRLSHGRADYTLAKNGLSLLVEPTR